MKNGVQQLSPERIQTSPALTAEEKADFGLDAAQQYEYAALEVPFTWDYTAGSTLVRVEDGANSGGEIDAIYELQATLGDVVGLDLSGQDYADASLWKKATVHVLDETTASVAMATNDWLLTSSPSSRFYSLKCLFPTS